METMKARVLREVGNLEYCDYPMPEVKPDEVLFRVRACGVCGSDIPRIFVNGTYHFPTIPGHEFAGEVAAVGDEKNKDLIGMRATVFPLIPCKRCENCNNGSYEMCSGYDYLGSRFEVAAMTEPCAVALHALRRAQIEVGDNVVIYGPGTIGMLIAQWARAWGARVLLVGTDVNNWDFIESLGFTEYCNSSRENAIEWVKKMTKGIGADVAIEAVGIPLTACNCLESAASGGKVIFVGNPHGDFTFPQNTYWQILRKQLSIFGTWNSSYSETHKSDWNLVVDALSKGTINAEKLITHRFTLADMDGGLDIMKNNTEFFAKVMVITD